VPAILPVLTALIRFDPFWKPASHIAFKCSRQVFFAPGAIKHKATPDAGFDGTNSRGVLNGAGRVRSVFDAVNGVGERARCTHLHKASDMKTQMIPEFRIKALCNDEATGEFFFRVVFRNVDGAMVPLDIARSKIGNKKTLVETLRNAGAFFHDDDTLNDEAIDRLIRSQSTAQRVTFAKATGWRDDGKLFVTPGEVIGANGGPSRILPPRGETHLQCERQGTLAGWKQHVAEPARMSSRLAFAICLGLAGPLLRRTELHSFGVLVAGLSKSGKSTLQIAGGSVIGLGTEDQLPSFDITDAGLSELLACSNDLLVPLNEEGLMAGTAAECTARLRRMAYVIAQASGTTYSTRAHMSKHGAGSERRCIVLASGEESIDEVAQNAGQIRQPGAMIRFIDLPATRRGAMDIFDLAPVMSNNDQRLRWVYKTCMKIRNGAEAHHGVALSALTRKVIRRRAKIDKRLRLLRKKFVDEIATDQDDHIIRHMALLFGHVYAAGILGVRFNILPWPEEFVMTAIKRCWNGARRSLRLESELRRAAIKTLMQKANGASVVQASSTKPVPRRYQNADGFHRRQNGERQLVVRGERFKDWFSDSRQPGILLRWLGEQGALANSKRGQHSGSSIVWAESQVEWPDGSRPRSIVIRVDKLKQ
jgi:hypothetical protein